MGEKIFLKPISGSDDKQLRFRIVTRKGEVVAFLVQLEVAVKGAWRPIVRYDNAHGFAHRDVSDPSGYQIEKHALKLATLEEVLEYAEQDLLDRADWYAERFSRTGIIQ